MKNKKSLFAICCSVIFAVVSIMAIWLYKAGAFNEAPVIAERPNNTYENTLRVATFEDNQPFSYYGENMEKTGYNVELSNDLANRLGMNLSLRFMTSEQAKEALLEGDIDIIMNSPEEDLDDERILISVPTYKENIVAFGKSYASNSAQLNGRKIAMVDNTDVREALESYNIENLHENLSVYSDPRDAMIALINDECDYAVMRYSIGCNILNQIGDKTVKGYFSLAYSLMRIGARDDNAELLERIDAAITAKKDSGSLDALRDKWTSVFFGNFSTNEFIRENIAVLVIVLLVLFLVVIILITYSYHTAIHDSVLRENEKELMVAKLSEDYDAIFMFNPEIEEYLGKQGSTKRDDNIYAVFGTLKESCSRNPSSTVSRETMKPCSILSPILTR